MISDSFATVLFPYSCNFDNSDHRSTLVPGHFPERFCLFACGRFSSNQAVFFPWRKLSHDLSCASIECNCCNCNCCKGFMQQSPIELQQLQALEILIWIITDIESNAASSTHSTSEEEGLKERSGSSVCSIRSTHPLGRTCSWYEGGMP